MKRITGTMRGLGALEVAEHIKGAFIADEGLSLADVGRLEKQRVVVYLLDDDPAEPQPQNAPGDPLMAAKDAFRTGLNWLESVAGELQEYRIKAGVYADPPRPCGCHEPSGELFTEAEEPAL